MTTAVGSETAKAPVAFPVLEAGDSHTTPVPYTETEDVVLPAEYKPTKYDVINGRGKKSYNHIANRRFRQLTAMNLKRYQNAKCKVDKTLVVIGIVNSIRQASPSGGFIKKCPTTGRWISMSDEGAREKVGHCLRDMIANKREETRSCTKATSQAEEKIRAFAHSNQSAFFPPSCRGSPGAMPIRAVHPNFVPEGLAHRGSMKKTPKTTTPQKGNAVVASAAARMAHRGNPPPVSEVPQIARTFNNFDYSTVAKGNNQEMSVQQRKILQLLEGGFKGSVEDLLKAVQQGGAVYS